MSDQRLHIQIHLPHEVYELVRSDGVARQVTSLEGGEYMMFLDDGLVRSCSVEEWPSIRSSLIVKESKRLGIENARQDIISSAQWSVGVPASQLNLSQIRSLLNILLAREGAVDENGAIRPIDQWLR